VLLLLRVKEKSAWFWTSINTLWGGVVGEAGIEGIELSDYKEGARYKDFQRKLKEIKDLGIILAVVSKNNFDDATDLFTFYPAFFSSFTSKTFLHTGHLISTSA